MKISHLFLFLLSALYLNSQNTIGVEPAMPILHSYDKVRDFTIDGTGEEAYFTLQSQLNGISVICRLQKIDGNWAKPKIASFSGKHNDLEPFLTHDGLRLFFVSNRTISDSISTPKDFDIWYVERTDTKAPWGLPKNIGPPINTEGNEFYPTLASNGNLYFTFDGEGSKGKDDIFMSQLGSEGYSTPVSLSEAINSEGYEYNAYISKHESFLLFGGYNRKDGYGNGDIYISYKNKAGIWEEAVPLSPEINTKYMDYCPFVDEINNIIYFTSIRAPEVKGGFKDLSAFEDYLNAYENGNSRLYKAPLRLRKSGE